MRARDKIPREHRAWLHSYLHRADIPLADYPDGIASSQWAKLRGAYRQMLLKDRQLVDGYLEVRKLKSVIAGQKKIISQLKANAMPDPEFKRKPCKEEKLEAEWLTIGSSAS